MIAIPQLIIFLSENDELLVEAPGANGARVKVPLESGWELASIREALYAQRAKLKERELAQRAAQERESHLRSERVIARVAIDHGTGFAKKIFGEKYAAKGNLAPKPRVAQSLVALAQLANIQ